MIAVIADDFTGAAELAGISLRYGLQVKLYTGLAEYETGDICIVASNSRSMPAEAAVDINRKIVSALQLIHPVFIYKKIDSVLRGHVPAELKTQMSLTGKQKAVVIPANPSLGRIITDGRYYVQNKIITETDFIHDPEFPVRSANVKDMFSDSSDDVTILRRITHHFNRGIILAETASIQDIDHWVKKTDPGWLLAGAGDFFERILHSQFTITPTGAPELLLPHLYVCGTTSAESRKFIDMANGIADVVVYLQEGQLFQHPCFFSPEQLDHIQNIVSRNHRLILIIGQISEMQALRLRTAMASLVKQLLDTIAFRELFIEGGATAAAIFEQLDLHSFIITNELQRGVVRMRTNELFVTVKPGSYAIPAPIRDLYLIKADQ